jgi:hypothetical protein
MVPTQIRGNRQQPGGKFAFEVKTRLLLRFCPRTASVLDPQSFLISFVAIHL